MKLNFPIFLIICLAFNNAFSQVDTIHIQKNELVISQLKEGTHQYLVYFENTKKKRIMNYSLWSREVKFNTFNNQPVIEITQSWHSSDTLYNRNVYSLSKKGNFEPIFHKTKMTRGVEAYNFSASQVSKADSVSDNQARPLNKDLPAPTLNWELDLEVFSTLPIKKTGQSFVMNFYHPGGGAPAYYEYIVVGSEKLSTIEGQQSDCWKLRIDYNPDSWAIFWISKKTKEVLKMQESYKGNYRYKVKLSTVVPIKSPF